MGIDFYSGLSASVSASENSSIFNKTAINADGVKKRIGFHGAEIMTQYGTNRNFSNAVDPISGVLIIPFSILCYDTDNIWDQNKPDRLIVPPGFNYAELSVHAQLPNGGTLTTAISVAKNGNGNDKAGQMISGSVGKAVFKLLNCASVIVPVIAGDYFQGGLVTAGSLAIDQTMSSDYSPDIISLARFACFSLKMRLYL